MGTSKLSGKPDEMLGGYLRCISIPSRRSTPTETSKTISTLASVKFEIHDFLTVKVDFESLFLGAVA